MVEAGLRKAAVLLAALGESAARVLYPALDDAELRALSREIAALDRVDEASATDVLEEFATLSEAELGGADLARLLLEASLGKDRADALAVWDERNGEFEPLHRSGPERVARLLENESPQAIALMLAQMDSRQGAALLRALPAPLRSECLIRIARLQRFSPAVASRVAGLLEQRLQQSKPLPQRLCPGAKSAADLINRLDPELGKELLLSLEQTDPQLALELRNMMFTFSDFATVPAAGIRSLLSAVDKGKLALALRGAPEQVKAQFLSNMSERAAELMREDMEALGPVRGKDVKEAQAGIVNLARELEAQGKIMLSSGDEGDLLL